MPDAVLSFCWDFVIISTMETRAESRIVYVERLGGGVVIGFDDGKTALYSPALLRSMFESAQELLEPEDDD
jgi:hypothetical protein